MVIPAHTFVPDTVFEQCISLQPYPVGTPMHELVAGDIEPRRTPCVYNVPHLRARPPTPQLAAVSATGTTMNFLGTYGGVNAWSLFTPAQQTT